MTISNVLVLLAQTGFVLLFALIIGLTAKKRPAARSAIYRLSIVAAIALAIGSPWLHERARPIVPIEWTLSHSFVSATATVKETIPPVGDGVIATQAPAPSAPFDPAPLLLRGWLVVAAILALRLVVGQIGLSRIHRGCSPIDNSRVTRMMADIAQQRGIRCPTVVEGPRVDNPFVAGVFRPTIYFPAGWAEGTSDDVLSAVLHHEVAHIANGDLRWNLAYRLACSILWPQPLLWLLRRRMSAVNEELCDQQVVAGGIPGPRYAECLLNLREGIKSATCPTLGICAVSSRSSLGRRVEAILDPQSRSAAISRRLAMSLKVGAVLLASGAALLFAHPAFQPDSTQDSLKGWTVNPYGGYVQIVSGDGKPVEEAKAWLVLGGDKQTFRTLAVKEDAVVIPTDNIPRETRATLVVQGKGYGIGFTNLWPVPKPIHRIVLPHPATLLGRFRNPDGTGVGGFGIKIGFIVRKIDGPMMFEAFDASTLPGLKFETSQATDGSFQIDGLCPGTTVDFQPDDDRYAQLRYADRGKLHVGAGVTHIPDITLRPAAQVTGRVTRDGKPVVGLRVSAQGQATNDGWGDGVTDADGRYVIGRLGAGAYNVGVNLLAAGLERDWTAIAREGVTLRAGDRIQDVNFALIPGVIIQGHVTDSAGKPVVGTFVSVYGPAHPKTSAWVQSSRTDRSGAYRLRVPPGTQYVYIGDSTYEENAQTVTVKSGTKRLDFLVVLAPPRETAPAEIPAAAGEEIKEPDESVPTPPTLSFGAGAPFYGPAKLAGGGEVTLAFVQDDVAAPHTLWRPDGSPAAQTDVARSIDMHGFEGNGPVRSLFLRVEIAGLERGSYDCQVKVPQTSNWSIWQTYGDQHDRSMDLASFRAPQTLKVTDMRFGVAYKPFQVLESAAIGEGPLYPRVSVGDSGHDGSPGVSVTVNVPDGIDGRDVRLNAYDRSGKSLNVTHWETSSVKRKSVMTRSYGFSGARPADVVRVELVARDYEWVTFKGIHLNPTSRP